MISLDPSDAPTGDAPKSNAKGWQLWIEQGETFTDILACRPDGTMIPYKFLSAAPDRPDNLSPHGLQQIVDFSQDQISPEAPLDMVKIGTNLGLNTLLHRMGEPCLLLITEGFKDSLEIPDAFATAPFHAPAAPSHAPAAPSQPMVQGMTAPKSPLYGRVIEIPERIAANGQILRPLESDSLRDDLIEAYQDGFRTVAIVLLHGYRALAHEMALMRLVHEIGFTHMSVSHEVSPLMKLTSRGDTTLIDAYLAPVLQRYVEAIRGSLRHIETTDPADMSAAAQDDPASQPTLRFMQSHGGLTGEKFFRGKDCLLSGPAGGVMGAIKACRLEKIERFLSLDMGGSATDISHYDQEFERSFESLVAAKRLCAPMLQIESIAIAGNSVCHLSGAHDPVGPNSAGADPGPASYGRGGPLTLTDCAVLLGRLQPDFFPQIAGPDCAAPLDQEALQAAFAAYANSLAQDTGQQQSPTDIASYFLFSAVTRLAQAIIEILTQRGGHAKDYTLCSFGGAAGQYACLIAEAAGISKILIPTHPGLLSAFGIGQAPIREIREKAIAEPFSDAIMDRIERELKLLTVSGRDEVLSQNIAQENVSILRHVHLRYAGAEKALIVPFASYESLKFHFEDLHRQDCGFVLAEQEVIVEAVSIEIIGEDPPLSGPPPAGSPAVGPGQDREDSPGEAFAQRLVYRDGQFHETPVYDRASLRLGQIILGPALIVDFGTSITLDPGWTATVTDHQQLLLTFDKTATVPLQEKGLPLAVLCEAVFASLPRQMGHVLEKTALSAFLKSNRAYSCAVLDAEGHLIACTEHYPLHFAALGASVKALLAASAARDDLAITPGRVYMLNDPYAGGSALSDIAVLTPAFRMTGDTPPTLSFWLVSHAHHQDMDVWLTGAPPLESRVLAEEGVLLPPSVISDQDVFQEQSVQALLQGDGTSEERDQATLLERIIADLKAQIAANAHGLEALQQSLGAYDPKILKAVIDQRQDRAEQQVWQWLSSFTDGTVTCALDQGSQITLALTLDHENRRLSLDFTGSSAQSEDNYNIPVTVTQAALFQGLRLISPGPLPVNAGAFRPLALTLPPGSVVNPARPAAVFAGIYETSQVVLEALHGALGLLAASQGTTNLFIFGKTQDDYVYEALGSGTGAGPEHAGAHAIQASLAPFRLMDPELLEWRLPVRVDGFAFRAESGGYGAFPGGNGVIRRIRFLEAMTAFFLSNRRQIAPHGLAGGGPGSPGRTVIERADGREDILTSTTQVTLNPHDVFVIETPGGGGHG